MVVPQANRGGVANTTGGNMLFFKEKIAQDGIDYFVVEFQQKMVR